MSQSQGPIAYMARNHVAANILMLILVVGGLLIGRTIKQEVFPEFELNMVSVTVAYPGATPAEVEDAIVRPIELAVSGIDNVKRVRATAQESVGSVTIEVLEGADPDQVLQDAKSEVDRIRTFPEEAEKPFVTKLSSRREVITLLVHGNVSERALREQAERVRDDLLVLPEITQVQLAATRPYEISVEISEDNLRKYNLTLDRVAQIIRVASLDLAGGSVKADGGEVLIRTTEKRHTGAEFASVAVFTHPSGRQLFLSDIATVKDGFAELDQDARFDGRPAIMIQVFRVGDQKPRDVSRAVREYVDQRNTEMPPSLGLDIYQDRSIVLDQRMQLLFKNGLLGLLLVLIILSLFLEIRLAFWVAAGIAISFLGALLLLPGMGISINMISLFAFLIILGVVVDDAIVVGENIFVHRKEGMPLQQAAISGAREMSLAVSFAALTTIAVFGPLLLVGGFVGNFLGQIPKIVITVLAISLVESLFILPSHLSGGLVRSRARIWERIERQRSRFDRLVRWLIDETYVGTLAWAKRNRYLTLALALLVLLTAVGIVGSGLIKFVFFPRVEADEVVATLVMPPGTPFEVTRGHAERIESLGMKIVQETDATRTDDGSNLKHVFTLLGQQLVTRGHSSTGSTFASNLAQVRILLDAPGKRTITSGEFADRWRKAVGSVPGAERLSFRSDLVRSGGDIEIELSHANYDILLTAVDRLKEAMSSYAGTREVSDTHSEGKRELKLRLRPEAATLGIRERDLAVQVRSAFYGAEALRIQRGQNEVKVMVRYPEADRRTMATIDRMRLRTASGLEVPFRQAAFIEEGRGYSTISRSDRRRVVTVTVLLDKDVGNPDEMLADLRQGVLRELTTDHPGLSYDLGGPSRDQRESMLDLRRAFLFGLLLIFAVLAVPFRSFVQPLVVMSAIPFGIVGAILGHLLLGYNLSMISAFGIIALTGVVVNASLVMIDFINRARRAGVPVDEAVKQAGMRRFRPIVMTAITTFVGLAPMIVETSIQARFLIPMAISLGFGVLFSTGVTLILVPTLYMILEDVMRLFRGKSSASDSDATADLPGTMDSVPASE